MKNKRYSNILRLILGWLLSLVIIFPMAVILLNTFKTASEASKFNLALPHLIQWRNYPEVIAHSNLVGAFLNSLLTSLPPTAVSIVVSAMAAFVISRKVNKLSTWIYRLFFFGLMIPINYIPIVALFKWLHLLGSYLSIMLMWTTCGIPFVVFLYRGFIESVSREIDEAGVIDGCGSLRLFFSIIFPLLKPVTVTGFLLNFINYWNDFKTPLYLLNSSHKWGMIMNMYGYFGQRQSDWNLACTVIVLTLLPTLIIYILGQKYIIAGMTAGSVKG